VRFQFPADAQQQIGHFGQGGITAGLDRTHIVMFS
jgi:hypothetical protein